MLLFLTIFFYISGMLLLIGATREFYSGYGELTIWNKVVGYTLWPFFGIYYMVQSSK